MLREKLNSGHEKECPKANIFCEYRNIGCKWSGQRHQVQHHLNSDMKEHLSMMNVALASLLSANGRERNRPASRTEASTSAGASSSNAADTVDRNLEEFNRLVKRNNDQINALMLRTEQIEPSFRDLTARVDRQHRENEAGLTSVKNTIVDLEARMCNGVYLWRITNYPRHRENARENVVTALHSPPFYTSFYGYKLCLRINPNGVDTGYGSHVSLFVHMMQTEWDDTLEWPFSGRISLSILDQSDDGDYKRHISETLVTRPNLLAFQRPTTPRNHKGYGYVEFAQAETLQDRQYLKMTVFDSCPSISIISMLYY
ncbi:TNF receptor-associated factor 6-like [Xenia sp. Carnegie-2017]|uniref:TNF receptor-associated factor 6-like n=1 Tax=Xenia sp. Carnegie-2017 TaxID=2897299 RepID=UPI001F04E8A5|nr:TNF receptor-associated factor 6-like [Xenia sp. Carnegie-2017]